MSAPIVSPGIAASAATEAIADAGIGSDLIRVIALLMEGLLSEKEFSALTGVEPGSLSILLADAAKLAEVQRAGLKLRNSGSLARLEAARNAREAIEIAAQIMRDAEMHASTRLNAAAFIAKVSGVDRPADDAHSAREQFRVVIHFSGHDPQVVGAATVDADD
jgi:hypothetical protein